MNHNVMLICLEIKQIYCKFHFNNYYNKGYDDRKHRILFCDIQGGQTSIRPILDLTVQFTVSEQGSIGCFLCFRR